MSDENRRRELARGEAKSKIHWGADTAEVLELLRATYGLEGAEADTIVAAAIKARKSAIRKKASIALLFAGVGLAVSVTYFFIQGSVGFVVIGFGPILMALLGLSSLLMAGRSARRLLTGDSSGPYESSPGVEPLNRADAPAGRGTAVTLGKETMSDGIPSQTLEVNVPAGIVSPFELLRVLSDGLKFPSYFGHNWNALFDCLCDFTWLEERTRVVIRHHDGPALLPPDRDAYLKTLCDAVGSWRTDPGAHTLEVEFPDADLTAWINGRPAPENTSGAPRPTPTSRGGTS